MKCPRCNAENPTDARFCNACGGKLELACPQCGKTNPVGSRFCNACGSSLQATPQKPSIDFSQPRSYTPRHLADKIAATRGAMEGERKLVTILFADVADYTAMSERLDPEEVHQIMDGCYRILMDRVHRYEGTVNQFTGDGIMALFGAPIAHEDHAQRACRAALAIQEALVDFAEELKRRRGIAFSMRIGINSGLVIVDTIGNDLQMDYTALGDTVNLASRMESLSAPGGVLVSENTHRLARDFFKFRSRGSIKVKGKRAPQAAFDLMRTGEVETRMGASVARGLTRFVGRHRSLPALLGAFERAKSGSGQVVGLVGDAGVGKSRLLYEMRNRLAPEEYGYLEGRCLEYGGSMAYLPILYILRSYLEIREGDREALIKKRMQERILGLDENLGYVIAPLQSLLSLSIEDEAFAALEPKERRERTFEALRDLLVRGSQQRPLILAIEDAHWIDRTTEAFLDYMIGWLTRTPILLIILYRPEYTHPWGSKSYYTKIGLDQLSPASSSELIQAVLEDGETAPELRQLILDRAAGNPLFMEEFTHSLLENGAIQRKDEKYVLSKSSADIQVPDTIQGIIAARMDRLENNLKRTMQVASVIGRDFAFRILQAISEMRAELKSHLLNLQGLEFIYEKRLFPELEYIFKHALTREVAYNSLLLKRRKEIHARIGQAIEELYPDRLAEFYEMLAHHYSKSDSLEKACRYCRLAGEKAEAAYAHSEALDFFKSGLDLLDRLPDTTENKRKKMEVLYLMRLPLLYSGYPEESLVLFQEGGRLAEELGDQGYLARFDYSLGVYHSLRGDPRLGVRYLKGAFEEARKNQDIELMGPLALGLFVSYLPAGKYYKIADMAPDVIDLIEKAGKESDSFSLGYRPYPRLCSYCGQSMGFLGRFDEGRIFLEKGLRNASKVSYLPSLGVVEMQYGFFYWAKGDWESSKAHFEKGIGYSEEANDALISALSWSSLGLVCAMLGDHEIGKKYAGKGLEIHRGIGVDMFLSLAHFQLGWIYLESGDLKNARGMAEESLRLSKKNGEKFIEGWSRILLGKIVGREAPHEIHKAEEYIRKGIAICEKLKTRPFYTQGYLFLGQLYLNAGDKEKAIELLQKAEAMFREMGMDYWLGEARAALAGL